MPIQKNPKIVLTTFLIICSILLWLCFKMVAPYLLTLLMGLILSYLTQPLYKKLISKKFSSFWAAFTVTVGLILIVLGPVTLFTMAASKQAVNIAEQITNQSNFSFEGTVDNLYRIPFLSEVMDKQQLQMELSNFAKNISSSLTKFVLNVVQQVPEILLQIILAVLACFFFLIDGARMANWIFARLLIEQDIKVTLAETFQSSAVAVIWATILAALAQATIMGLAYSILGIPGAFLAAGTTFIFSWLPVVGSTPVAAIGAVYLFANEEFIKIIFMLIFALMTGLIDNIIRPWVLKGSNDLHPLVGLIAIIGGLNVFGVIGIFIGPVIVAITLAMLEVWPIIANKYLNNSSDA